jgi:hypothetical protein
MMRNVIKAERMVGNEGHMQGKPHARHRPQSDTPPAKVLGKYRGQWVAYYNRRVVANGDNFGKVLDEARTLIPGKEPTLMKVPSGELYVL